MSEIETLLFVAGLCMVVVGLAGAVTGIIGMVVTLRRGWPDPLEPHRRHLKWFGEQRGNDPLGR